MHPDFSKTYRATIISICPEKDIALLKININSSQKSLSLGNPELININDCINIYYNDKTIKSHKTNIILINKYFVIKDKYPMKSYGCPVFNKDDKLIGFNKIILFNNNFTNVVVPISYLFSILSELFNNKIVYIPRIFIETQNINNQSIIKQIHKFSPLINNIKESDIILNINNHTNLNTLKHVYNVNDNFKMQYKSKDNKNHTIKFKPSCNNIFCIKFINFPFEKLDYIILNHLIFMQLKMDHLININSLNLSREKLHMLNKFKKLKNRIFSVVFISHMFRKDSVFEIGDIIIEINDKKISKISDIQNIVFNTNNKNLLVVKTILDETKILDLHVR